MTTETEKPQTTAELLHSAADILGAWLTDNTEHVFEEQPEVDDARGVVYDAIRQAENEHILLKACFHFLNMLPNEKHSNNVFGIRESYDLAHALGQYLRNGDIAKKYRPNGWVKKPGEAP